MQILLDTIETESSAILDMAQICVQTARNGENKVKRSHHSR